MQANPLVEEVKNQIAVKRGPLVYCLESNQLPNSISVNQVLLDVKSTFTVKPLELSNRKLMAIEANVRVTDPNFSWNKTLYKPLSTLQSDNFSVQLIPYFAWGNHSKGEMSVWLPY